MISPSAVAATCHQMATAAKGFSAVLIGHLWGFFSRSRTPFFSFFSDSLFSVRRFFICRSHVRHNFFFLFRFSDCCLENVPMSEDCLAFRFFYLADRVFPIFKQCYKGTVLVIDWEQSFELITNRKILFRKQFDLGANCWFSYINSFFFTLLFFFKMWFCSIFVC